MSEPVTIYTSATWGDCQRAKEFFSQNGVEFIERKLEEPGVAEECIERTGFATKTTMIIGGQVVSGFASNFDQVKKLVEGL